MAEKQLLRPAVFLDRDGTIGEELGYVNHIDRFQIFPYAAEAIRLISFSYSETAATRPLRQLSRRVTPASKKKPPRELSAGLLQKTIDLIKRLI